MRFLALLALAATTTLAFTFKLVNKSGRDIYVYTSSDGAIGNCGATACDSEEVRLANGGTYVSPYTLTTDAAGITIKAAFERHKNPYRPNYQVECSKKDGVLWYNFSKEEGNVFLDVPRTLYAPGCADVAHCDGGSNSCDWFACPGGGDCNIKACGPVPGELVAVIGE